MSNGIKPYLRRCHSDCSEVSFSSALNLTPNRNPRKAERITIKIMIKNVKKGALG